MSKRFPIETNLKLELLINFIFKFSKFSMESALLTDSSELMVKVAHFQVRLILFRVFNM